MPVVYSEVDRLTTEFYSAANGEYDFVVHTGVGFQFTLEGVAHREGYRGQDANGMFIAERDGHPVFGKLTPELLEIDVNFEDVMRRWRSKAPVSSSIVLLCLSLERHLRAYEVFFVRCCTVLLHVWFDVCHDHQSLPDLAQLGTDLYPSKDAGRYLCEYIYYSSLATLHLRKNRRTSAVFMHVPPPNDPLSIELGKKVLIALIYSLVECKIPKQVRGG